MKIFDDELKQKLEDFAKTLGEQGKSAVSSAAEGLEAAKDMAKDKLDDVKPDLETIIKRGQEKVRQGQEKAADITETGKGILGRFSKAFKAFKE